MSDHNRRPGRGQWAGLTLQQQALLWGLALAGLAAVLYFLSPILAPFVAGTALGYLLDPVADRLQKAGLSRLGAALLILVCFVLAAAALLLLIAPILSRQLAAFITSLPGYLATLQGLLSEWSEKFTGEYFNDMLQKVGLGGAASGFDAQKYISDIAGEAAVLAGDFLKSMLTRGVALINVASLVVVTPVVAFYMLLDWDKMIAVCDQLVPERHRADVRSLARDIDTALAGFLRGQSLVCLFLGVWYALGLSLIGLNFGFLIGVLAGLLSFIPYVGSLTAFVLSIIVALVQSWPDWRLPAEAIAVVSAGLFLDGNVLSPRLVGDAVGLHPVWLMFALFAFGSLFGFTGLIIAVPVAAALGVILRFLARRYRSSALYLHPHHKA
jgi:predicted PurR-regulated permease PerM